MESQYLWGYFLAFLDALVWSIYTLAARYFNKSPAEAIGIYCGIGALCSIVMHFHSEVSFIPSNSQWFILIVMGMTTQCLAFFFWSFGVKHGNFSLLSILSYGNPLLSIVLLICFGMAEPSYELFVACAMVSLGGIIGIVPWDRFYLKLQHAFFDLPAKAIRHRSPSNGHNAPCQRQHGRHFMQDKKPHQGGHQGQGI